MKDKLTLDNGKTLTVTLSEEELAKLTKVEETAWKPNDTNEYWWLDDEGIVYKDLWSDNRIDTHRHNIGNVYRTEQESEAASGLQEVRTRLKRSSTFKPDWTNDNQRKYHVFYNYRDIGLDFISNDKWDAGCIAYYESRDAAQQAIEEYREDWLKHFQVEEKK